MHPKPSKEGQEIMPNIINNGNVNAPSDGVKQGLFEESSTQQGNVGAERRLEDGRAFRYAYFAAAANTGLLVSTDVSATCVVEVEGSMTGASAAATSVTITDSTTLGSATADQYAGAYLHIGDDAGEGYQYRIRGNTAASSNAVDFTLYDGLLEAVTSATDWAITGYPYNNVRGAVGTADYIVSGVTIMDVTANYYAWVQTRGIATVLSNGAVAIGANLTLSDDVVGAVQLKDAETEPLVGFACFASDDTGHVGVKLYGLD